MKKLWISIVAILMAFSIVGCAHGGDDQSGSTEQGAQSSQTADNTGDGSNEVDSGSSDSETDGSDSTNDESNSDSTNDELNSDSNSSSEGGADTENPPSSGTVVPPITDGGNFDGTV